MPFLNDLVAKQVRDFDWELVDPLLYQGNRDRFEVPAGEQTDFASVPRSVQWLLPMSGRYTKAAVLHDHLWKKGPEMGVGLNDADGIFRKCMQELDVPFLQRWIMWAAVRTVSLVRSRFAEGPGDLLRVLALFVYPGLFLLAGGAIVVLLQVGFGILEALAAAVLALLRLVPMARDKVKPVVRPKMRWTP